MKVAQGNRASTLLGPLLLAGLASAVLAQPPADGPRPPMPGGTFGGPLDLLRRQDVRKELELLDDQLQQLEKLGERMRERRREAFSSILASGQEGTRERFDRAREAVEELNAETQRELNQILLPHQARRLRQLELQMRVRRGGLLAIGRDAVRELNVSEEQQAKLREKADQLDQELRKKIAELHRRAEEELLTLLTPAQQLKYRALLGPPFEFQEAERRSGPPAGAPPPVR